MKFARLSLCCRSAAAAVSNFSAVFKNADLSPRIQAHLVRVYQTLALALFTTALGVVADLQLHLGGQLSAIASILTLIALGMQRKEAIQQRVGLLALYGFLQGASLGPLIRLAIAVDPSILFTAVVGTFTVFACFSASAIFSSRRSYLYLGGILSSALSFLILLSLVSIFWRPVIMHSIQLYLGLAVFCAFVLYDTVRQHCDLFSFRLAFASAGRWLHRCWTLTLLASGPVCCCFLQQLMIEKAEMGSDDFVAHALELFLDFIAM